MRNIFQFLLIGLPGPIQLAAGLIVLREMIKQGRQLRIKFPGPLQITSGLPHLIPGDKDAGHGVKSGSRRRIEVDAFPVIFQRLIAFFQGVMNISQDQHDLGIRLQIVYGVQDEIFGLLQLVHLYIRVGDIDHHKGIIGLEIQGLEKTLQGFIEFSPFEIQVPQGKIGIHDVGIFPNDLFHHGRGLLVFFLQGQFTGPGQLVEHHDLVLGVAQIAPGQGTGGGESADIAQGTQFLAGFFIHHGVIQFVRIFTGLLDKILQPGQKPAGVGRTLFHQIVQFPRISFQVIQFQPWSHNQLEPAVLNALQLTPAVMKAGIKGFGIGCALHPSAAGKIRHQAPALDLAGNCRPGHFQDCGHDIHQGNGIFRDQSLQFFIGGDKNQRNTHSSLINKKPMGAFLMFTQALSMITRQHQKSIVQKTAVFQKFPKAPQLGISESDFAQIGPVRIHLIIRRRRVVRGVRIKKVNPGEKFPVLFFFQPGQGFIHDLVARALHITQRNGFIFTEIETIEIMIKALVQPPLGIQHISGHKSRGGVSPLPEQLRQGDERVRHQEAPVIPDTVKGGIRAGHNGGMRRQRQGSHGGAVFKLDPAGSKHIHDRGFHALKPVAADAVGPDGVHCDQDHIEIPPFFKSFDVPPGKNQKIDQSGRGHCCGD